MAINSTLHTAGGAGIGTWRGVSEGGDRIVGFNPPPYYSYFPYDTSPIAVEYMDSLRRREAEIRDDLLAGTYSNTSISFKIGPEAKKAPKTFSEDSFRSFYTANIDKDADFTKTPLGEYLDDTITVCRKSYEAGFKNGVSK